VTSPQRWQRVKQIFDAALEIAPAERAAFLELACALDLALRTEVESLLAALDEAGTFIDTPISPSAAVCLLRDLVPSESTSSMGVTGLPQASTPNGRHQARRSVTRQIIGHYELIEWLGAGGMGEVFRARDLALGRDAALKRLPQRFTPELRLRLLREAEACAKLQHPAIATFYEAGVEGGETFIAMEYVQGHTLRTRLANGAFSLEEALAITRCMLEALEHAHAAGILHRDVKPENVMTTALGSAKLLDFGLARHLLTPGALGFTNGPASDVQSGSGIAGTIGYMAPEQLRGEALDVRTDVFQVGAVLFEMLAGRPAFVGDSPLERLGAVLNQDPDFSPLAHRQLPPDLQKVLARALARDQGSRYSSAAAFLRDLEDLVNGRVVTALPKSIAVTDFDNRTGERELDWIGSDTAARIAAELATVSGVTVVPREKVVRRVSNTQDGHTAAVAVGLHLGCRWVVSGAVERVGALLRITLRLTDVATARVVTTECVDLIIDQLFATQEALAVAVAHAMGCMPPTTAIKRAHSIEAHESFARARPLLDQLSKASVEQALGLLERAATIDPEHAPALARLAWAYGFRSIATTDRTDVDKALGYADRAISVDPLNAEAHMWRGYALLRTTEYDEGARACRRASELAPAEAAAPYFAGSALLFGGRAAEALPWLQRSLDLESKVGMGWLALGAAHLSLQQLLEARHSFTRAREMEAVPVRFPTAGAAAYIAEVLRLEGQLDDARRYALEGVESAERSDHAYRDFFRAHALVVLGRTALDQDDFSAARAAFHQVLAQARGRPRTRSCGHMVVQSLTGMARADHCVDLVMEAHRVFDAGESYNFEPFFGALTEQTLFELAAASFALGNIEEARGFRARAQAAGSRRPAGFDAAN
jgi:serine/threonine-protein kinase